MRGKVMMRILEKLDERITPAYAGKSRACKPGGAGKLDHPRVCGEKVSPMNTKIRIRGSPPRMRGKDISSLRGVFIIRITPAYAGKRAQSCWRSVQIRGSPPRMRGKDGGDLFGHEAVGITPAYAGKSSCADKKNKAEKGSPPRMRGKD